MQPRNRSALFLLIAAAATLVAAPALAEPLPDCEWCGAMDAPPDDQLTATMTLAGEDEPGQRIILRGRVLQPGGKTPAPDVLVYAYQTDVTGVYRKEGGETGNARRHGVLRGWLRTDDQGRYEIRTIRPGSYPRSDEPAHIHVTLTPRGGSEHWIGDFWFDDDPLITRRHRSRAEPGAIVKLAPGSDGVLAAERDLLIRR